MHAPHLPLTCYCSVKISSIPKGYFYSIHFQESLPLLFQCIYKAGIVNLWISGKVDDQGGRSVVCVFINLVKVQMLKCHSFLYHIRRQSYLYSTLSTTKWLNVVVGAYYDVSNPINVTDIPFGPNCIQFKQFLPLLLSPKSKLCPFWLDRLNRSNIWWITSALRMQDCWREIYIMLQSFCEWTHSVKIRSDQT